MANIIIISHFASDYSATDNDRFLYIAKKMSKNHNIEIITSDFCHEKKSHRNTPKHSWPFKITFLNEPGYKKNVCLKRFYSHFVWGMNVKKYLKTIQKPDVIYCAIPSLTGPLNAAKFCKKNKIRFIVDIQDLWPEAFKMVFNPPLINKIIYYPFKKIANEIYKKADDICAVSNTYAKRAQSVNKNCKKAHSVFLGTNLKTFDENSKKDVVTDNINEKKCIKIKDNVTVIEDKEFKLYKPKNEIWIGYCGTLGSSYDLDNAITAISKEKEKKIRFIVMGNGPLYDKFIKKAKEENINAIFTGRIPYDIMCSILCKCDITINPIMHGAAQSIINKHADYVASGLPIVSTQECGEFCDLVTKYKIGYNCKNDDINEIASAISELAHDKKLRNKFGKNARSCAEKLFDREYTYKEIINLILDNK